MRSGQTDDEMMSIRNFALEIGEDYRKIYNNLNNQTYFLHRFIVLDKNNYKKVKRSAIDYYNSHSNKFDYMADHSGRQSDKSEEIINLLKERIEAQAEEIKIKNNQIEKLETLLDQEQRLAVSDREKIKLLEDQAEEEKEAKKGFFRSIVFLVKSRRVTTLPILEQ